jgi:hypothetical protein
VKPPCHLALGLLRKARMRSSTIPHQSFPLRGETWRSNSQPFAFGARLNNRKGFAVASCMCNKVLFPLQNHNTAFDASGFSAPLRASLRLTHHPSPAFFTEGD